MLKQGLKWVRLCANGGLSWVGLGAETGLLRKPQKSVVFFFSFFSLLNCRLRKMSLLNCGLKWNQITIYKCLQKFELLFIVS